MEALREQLAAARRDCDDLRLWRESAVAEHEDQLRSLRRYCDTAIHTQQLAVTLPAAS